MKFKRLNNGFLGKVMAVLISTVAFSSFSVVASQYEQWSKSDSQSTVVVNHKPMSSILNFLNGGGKKGEMAFYRTQGQVLEYVIKYRKYLEAIPVSQLNKDEQLAFWLNLHNATVIEMLSTDLKLTKKVKQLRGTPGNPGKEWAKKRVKVEKIYLSLEEIEQKILFGEFKEPLALYGLVYGTKGSPILELEAFKGATVKQQLADNAARFIAQKRNAKIKKSEVKLTSLYTWNKDVLFGGDDQAIIQHLQTYATGNTAAKLKKVTEVSSSHKYSWTTNAQSKPRQQSSGGGFSGSGGGGGGGYGGGS